MAQTQPFYIVGGTLPINAPCYITRAADAQLLSHLLEGEFCYVLNTRQIGKSSLMVRTAQRLREQGTRAALLDLTAIGQNVTVEEWYDGLLTLLGEQLHLGTALEDFWLDHPNLGPMQRWIQALHQIVLKEDLRPLCLFVDEIDSVRSLPFSTDEFFAGIRECYNRRVQDPVFKRLTFCLLGVAAPIDLIANPLISPFNIGQRVVLTDFTRDEALPLALGFGSRNGTEELEKTEQKKTSVVGSFLPLITAHQAATLDRVLYWTGGHPYLTLRLCEALVRRFANPTPYDADFLCQQLFLSKQALQTDDNLTFVRHRLLHNESERAALLDLYRLLLKGSGSKGSGSKGHKIRDDVTDPLHNALRLSGIVRVENGNLAVRNRIYGCVFGLDWALANLPGEEARRQKAAYRRGLIRSASLFGSLTVVIATLLAVAVVNAHHAYAAQKDASHALYISDINLIQREWEGDNITHVLELMNETRPSKEKGLEWDYWDRQSHGSLRTLSLPDRVSSVAIAPGQKQAVILCENGMLTLWNIMTGQKLRSLTGDSAGCKGLLYSPDGKLLLIGIGPVLQIRDAADWRLLHTLKTPIGDVIAIAASPDGAEVAVVTDMGCACIWNIATEQKLHIFGLPGKQNRDHFFNLAVTRGQLALFSNDGFLHLYDMQTGREIRRTNVDIVVGGVTFSRDGARLVGRDRHGNLNILDVLTGKPVLYLGNDLDLHDVHFSHDERFLFTAQGSTVYVWDARSGSLLHTFRDHADTVFSLSVTRDDHYLVSGSYDNSAKVWDVSRPANPLALPIGKTPLWRVMYSSDGRRIVTSSEDGHATILEADTGRKIRTIAASKIRITPAVFSHDGTRVFTGDIKGTGRLWDVETGHLVRRFVGHTEAINGVAFSPDDRALFTSSDDLTAIQWDVATGNIARFFRDHTRPVEALALSKDGTHLALGGDDRKATVWDVGSGKLLHTFPAPAEVWSVALSPDGTHLAVGNLRKTVEVWNLITGKRTHILRGHTHWVVSVAFSPDGKRLVTGSRDATAKIWELETGREVLTLKGHKGQVSDVTFAPDGRHIAAAGKDGELLIWDTTPR